MVSFIAIIAMGIVRGILNNIIGKFTPLQLQEAIDNDFSLYDNLTPALKKQTLSLRTRWGKYFNEYYDMITTELIFGWIQKDHPCLHGVMNAHPKGYEWLDKQVVRFKKEIRGY